MKRDRLDKPKKSKTKQKENKSKVEGENELWREVINSTGAAYTQKSNEENISSGEGGGKGGYCLKKNKQKIQPNMKLI
jgi:hypothetical protein